MGRIKGHYEWDDDDLSPGQKKEGGLHQNLFDGEGKLKGSARFIPGDGRRHRALFVTETVYVPVEQRRRTRGEEELEQAIAALVSHLIDRGIAKAKPLAEEWWRGTGSSGHRRPASEDRSSVARAVRRRRPLLSREPSLSRRQELAEARRRRPTQDVECRGAGALPSGACCSRVQRRADEARDGGQHRRWRRPHGVEALAGRTPARPDQGVDRGNGHQPHHARRRHPGRTGKHPRATRTSLGEWPAASTALRPLVGAAPGRSGDAVR